MYGKNTETFVVTEQAAIPESTTKLYKNHRFDWAGTLEQAREYAQKHSFCGGVEIVEKVDGVFVYRKA